ncbi:MAG TPA: hypothetical protein HA327_05180 [Candidatus Poseidoniaceae archaeon]|nr:MAG TPA: hypothetical protein D7H81_05105 [Candidatus Poseidoniales archaeon]HII45413.1 hypothetical protein [Candidatus Poseidoniaceae archaeon]
MAEDRFLDKAQARDIEEELFATRRQQASRHMPVPLPRQNFWEMVGRLLAGIDAEIQDMVMNGTTGLRLQNAQKRQANIRRIASELSRKRLVTMMQYLASQSLRTDSQLGTNQDLPPMDWARHDPAEKAFYTGIVTQMDRFKKLIDWDSMQKGILAEGMTERKKHSRGTMQLDSFIESPAGLTGQSPPELIIDDEEPQIELVDSQYDEEDRIYNEEWPDIDEYVKSGLDAPQEDTKLEPKATENSADKHMAAMELAPSKKKPKKIVETMPDLSAVENAEESTTATNTEAVMIRIRIVQSLPEPIVLGDGVEIALEEDDIHFIDKDTADWLVESGVAEVESL